MRVCAVFKCRNKGRHLYPTDPVLQQQWIRATRVDYQRKIGWHLRKSSCICSDHFKPDDFEIRGKIRPLKKTAVPTIFPWTTTTSWVANEDDNDDEDDDDDDDIAEPEDKKTEPLEFKFNPAKVVNKYSKSVPIRFIEEYPYLNTETTESNQDPLRSKSDERAETLKNISPVPVALVTNNSKSVPTQLLKEYPFFKINKSLADKEPLKIESDEHVETSIKPSPIPDSLVSKNSKSVPTKCIKGYQLLKIRSVVSKEPPQSKRNERAETSKKQLPVPVSLVSNYYKSVPKRLFGKQPALKIGTEKVHPQSKSDKHARTSDNPLPVPVNLVGNNSKTVMTRFQINTGKVPLQSENAKHVEISENPSPVPNYPKSGPSRFDEAELLDTESIETNKIPLESGNDEHAEILGNPSSVLVKFSEDVIKREIDFPDHHQMSVCDGSLVPVEFCTEEEIKSEINSFNQHNILGIGSPVAIEICPEQIIKSEICFTDQNQISFCDSSSQTGPLPEGVYENNQSPFSVHRYKRSKKAIYFYTGLQSFSKLTYVFSILGECPMKYFDEQPPSNIDAFEQFFITLLILRRHMHFKEIGFMYLIPAKHVKNIFITWIRFMALQWKSLDLWKDEKTVLTQKITLTSYKNRNTFKFFVGIARGGLITYISPCYRGSAASNQIHPDVSQKDSKEPSTRVHVEKVIGILKSFKIFKQPLNATETILSKEIALTCALLVNFRSTIVNRDAL